MKTKLILSLTLLTLVLAACGGQTAQTPSTTEAQPIQIPTLTPAPQQEVAMPTAEVPSTEVAVPTAEAPSSVAGVSYSTNIKPIFEGGCTECHGGGQTKAGLDMTTYDGLIAGSFNGAVIVPGNSTESLLVQLVSEGKMPKRGAKLTPEQVQVISDWISAGALNN
jgi:mono/diheme cytochrome c family protein